MPFQFWTVDQPSPVHVFPEEVASRVVQQSVATAADSLTGLSVQAPIEMPCQLCQSAGLSVDARVSKKLQAKIWNHEHIDFGSLLTNPVFENQYRLTFQGPCPHEIWGNNTGFGREGS